MTTRICQAHTRFVSERYAKNAGAVFSLKYHVVWCPKYRRSVLVKPVDTRLKTSWRLCPTTCICSWSGSPTICVAEIVNGLKGFTSHTLREEFPFLKSRLPKLWSRSYYAGSVGSVSEAVVRKYIEGQKGK